MCRQQARVLDGHGGSRAHGIVRGAPLIEGWRLADDEDTWLGREVLQDVEPLPHSPHAAILGDPARERDRTQVPACRTESAELSSRTECRAHFAAAGRYVIGMGTDL